MHAQLLGIVLQVNEIQINPSQIFNIYNLQSLFSGIHLTSPRSIRNNMTFLFQKCDTISQDHTWLVK